MLLSGVGVGLVSRAQNKKLEKQREELARTEEEAKELQKALNDMFTEQAE